MRIKTWLWVLMLVGAAVLAGCGSGDSDDNDSTQNLPEARSLLDEAASTIQTSESFGVEINIDGAPVALNIGSLPLPGEGALVVKYAKGMFLAPDRMRADIEIGIGALSTTGELIAIGTDHYLSGAQITGGQWLSGELIPQFSPASLQSEEAGIAHALSTITDLEMVGTRDLDGINVYHLRGKVAAQELNSVTFGLIQSTEGILDINVYVQTGSRRVERLSFAEPPPPDRPDDEPTQWNITLFDYNRTVTIEAPISSAD